MGYFPIQSDSISNMTNINNTLQLSESTYSFLISFNLFIVIVGIIGNGTLLYASFKHSILKMDCVTTALVEDLAFSDISYTILNFIPSLITLVTKRWVLGEWMCLVLAFVHIGLAHNEVLVITALSVYRLWKIWDGKVNKRVVSKQVVKLIISGITAVAVSAPIIALFLGEEASFVPGYLVCSWRSSGQTALVRAYHKFYYLLFGVGFISLPLVTSVLANLTILGIISTSGIRSGRGICSQMRTSFTLVFICLTFVLSYCPFIVRSIMTHSGKPAPTSMYLFVTFFVSLNTTLNPLMFVISSNSLRIYLKMFALSVFNKITLLLTRTYSYAIGLPENTDPIQSSHPVQPICLQPALEYSLTPVPQGAILTGPTVC